MYDRNRWVCSARMIETSRPAMSVREVRRLQRHRRAEVEREIKKYTETVPEESRKVAVGEGVGRARRKRAERKARIKLRLFAVDP